MPAARRVVLAVVLAASALSVASAAEGRRKLRTGELLPADGVCFIRAKSMSALVDGVSGFVDSIMPGYSALLKAQLGVKVFTDPKAAGIDPEKPVGVAVLNPKEFANPWVMVAPVSADQAVLQEIQNVLGAPEDAGGDLMKFAGGGIAGEEVFVRFASGHVVAGGSDSAVATIADAVKNKGLAVGGADDDLIAAVNVRQLLKLYGEELKGTVQGLRDAREAAAAGGAPAQDPMAAAMGPMAIFATLQKVGLHLGPEFAEMGVDVVDQIDGVEVALNIGKEKLSVACAVIAKADSSLEKLINEQKPVGAKTAGFVPAGGVMVMTGRLNEAALKPHLAAAMTKAREALGKVAGDDVKELRDELVGWSKLMEMSLVGGESEGAVSLVFSEGGVVSMQVVHRPELTAERLAERMQAGGDLVKDSKLLQGMAAAGGQMTVKIEKDLREHAGVKISRMTQDYPGAPPQMAAMMEKLYGMPQVSEYCFLDDKKAFVMTSGKGAAKKMDELVDAVIAGRADGSFAASPLYARIRAAAPPEAAALWAVSPTQYGKMVFEMMAPMMPFQLPADAVKGLDALAAQEEPIWGYVHAANGSATFAYEIPAPTLGRLVQYFQQLMVQMRQQMVPAQPMPPPPGDGIGGGVF